MSDFIAIKNVNGIVVKQRFTERAWSLLGPDKNNWVKTDPQTIDNSIEAAKRTGTGKDQVIENGLKKEPELKPVEIIEPPKEKDQVIENSDEQKRAEFLKHLDGFNKGTIKDFLDKQEPPLAYDNTAKLDALKNQLADFFKLDIIEFQKSFN
jgi:hypothetical protein